MKFSSVLSPIPLSENQGWGGSVMNSPKQFWSLLFIGIGIILSIIDSHPPLVGLAAVAGTTLLPKRAIGLMILVWFVNAIQIYRDPNYLVLTASIIWTLITGLGIALTTGLASIKPALMQKSPLEHLLWVSLVSLLGLIIVEALHTIFWNILGGYGLTFEVFGWMFSKELFWAITLTVGQWLVASLSRDFMVPRLIREEVRLFIREEVRLWR